VAAVTAVTDQLGVAAMAAGRPGVFAVATFAAGAAVTEHAGVAAAGAGDRSSVLSPGAAGISLLIDQAIAG
jgi:hypothetical protein